MSGRTSHGHTSYALQQSDTRDKADKFVTFLLFGPFFYHTIYDTLSHNVTDRHTYIYKCVIQNPSQIRRIYWSSNSKSCAVTFTRSTQVSRINSLGIQAGTVKSRSYHSQFYPFTKIMTQFFPWQPTD